MKTIENHIRDVLIRVANVAPEEAVTLGPEKRLFTGGLSLPSLVAIELLIQIEEEFECEIDALDFRLESIDTINSIKRLIERSRVV